MTKENDHVRIDALRNSLSEIPKAIYIWALWDFNLPRIDWGTEKIKSSCPCKHVIPGHVAQSVTCLATDASLTADPGVASSIPARPFTFVEIDHEIISTVLHLPSAES